MRWIAACAGALTLALASVGLADAFTPASVPQETRWVLHLDVDSARLTPLWDLARLHLVEPRRAMIMSRMDLIEGITGMKLPSGLHDVTLYGAAYDEAEVCIRIHGEIDEARTIKVLKLNPDFHEEPYNTHTIVTWRDTGRDHLMYGSFVKAGLVLLASSPKVVLAALDTLDGKTPGLKPGSMLAPPPSPTAGADAADLTPTGKQPMVWIAADGLSDLQRTQKPEFPGLAQMDAASLGIRWNDAKGQETEIHVLAKDEKMALQMQTIVEGMKAMLAMQAADEHATPRSKVISAALQQLTVSIEGKMVKANWALTRDKIDDLAKIAVPATMLKPAGIPPGATDK